MPARIVPHRRTPWIQHLLSIITVRVSRLMVVTQQVNGKTKSFMQALNKSKVYLAESTLHVRFINFSHLVTM
jgi:hypothetical protein